MAGTAEGLYEQLSTDRQGFLRRARQVSQFTLPHLLNDSDEPEPNDELVQSYQSLGARAVNALASKMMLALFPVGTPFHRFDADPGILRQMDPKDRTALQLILGSNERSIGQEIEVTNLRPILNELLLQLVVTGNALLDMRERRARLFLLDSYVCQRDPMGLVSRIITRERVEPRRLPEHMQDLVRPEDEHRDQSSGVGEKYVKVYTHVDLVEREGGKNTYRSVQEVGSHEVPGSEVIYAEEFLPLIPQRFYWKTGEDYGRGHVEQYLGDLRSLEGLNQAIVEGSAAAAKVLFLVNPQGLTKPKTVAQAPNGAVRPGRADDVSTIQTNKFADFRVALEMIARLERRVSFAFLLNSTAGRDAERVTAEEVRLVAQELDDNLGGVFAQMGPELQLPVVRILRQRLERESKLVPLADFNVEPVIVTGSAGLGRAHEVNRLEQFVRFLLEKGGPEAIRQLHLDELSNRLAAGLGIDPSGLVKTREELQQEQQQAQLLQMVQQLGPEAIKQLGPSVVQNLRQQTGVAQ